MKKVFLFLLLANSTIGHCAEKIRIGWQVPWTLQGQLVQILKNTSILKDNGIEAEFLGKTFGPELNEAAMAGAVDVILTADQPAAVLFSKNPNWMGIGRLMYNRTSTYVPPQSKIQSLSDIRGKTVGLPKGAAAERIFFEAIEANSIPKEEIKVVHLGMLEHMPLVLRSNRDAVSWGQFDALAGFDPIPAILESSGKVRTVHSGKVCALILMKKGITVGKLKSDERVAKALLRSIDQAYEFYKKNSSQADKWFLEEAKLKDVDAKTIRLTNSLEPNFKNKVNRLWFTEEDFQLMQKGADFATASSEKKIDMKAFVTNKFAKQNP
jgi:ABC-type nitrate/sulfonate/bicarbonate transport system substrate-binding protein